MVGRCHVKIDEYAFRRVPRDVRDFADQATLIFNYGKYSAQTVTTPPTWIARNGEFAFFQSSTSSGNRVYFYANNQWNWMAGSPTGGGVAPGGLDTQVQVNSQNVALYADSGFTYIANSALGLRPGVFLTFNTNTGSNVYMMYNNSSTYLETYIQGQIRLQM